MLSRQENEYPCVKKVNSKNKKFGCEDVSNTMTSISYEIETPA